MESLWTQGAEMPAFPRLKRDLNTDVLIVGGGMAGLLCAYMLKQAGVECTLIEKDRICGGVTGMTTAKITAQHGLIYHKLTGKFGLEGARLYLKANLEALEDYRRLSQRVECGFEVRDNYVYSTDRRDKVELELRALEQIGFRADFAQQLPLPFAVTGAVKFPRQAQFHPLKFAAGIAGELKIYEHTAARSFEDRRVRTDGGVIRADKVVIATHFPILNKHGSYFLKMYQHRSYVLALEDGRQVDGMYVDEKKTGLSFRNYGNLLLLGGGAHRTGKQGGGWNELSDFALRHAPQAREVSRWATQDCMTLDDMPYIGQYSKRTPGLYVATGFNKWGMSSSMVAARVLTDLILERENPYAGLFSPSRTMLRPQLLLNGVEAAGNLLTPTVPRCPHMGCALKWNAAEHTWDCPCHGSRFTKEGRVLDNPATGDLKGNRTKKETGSP